MTLYEFSVKVTLGTNQMANLPYVANDSGALTNLSHGVKCFQLTISTTIK